MNLVDKLEKLDLEDVNQPSSEVTPTALMEALENLTYANAMDASCRNGSASVDPEKMRRNFSTTSVESMGSPKMSPMHRSSSVGLNMICDLGSPTNVATLDICAKFQVVWCREQAKLSPNDVRTGNSVRGESSVSFLWGGPYRNYIGETFLKYKARIVESHETPQFLWVAFRVRAKKFLFFCAQQAADFDLFYSGGPFLAYIYIPFFSHFVVLCTLVPATANHAI